MINKARDPLEPSKKRISQESASCWDIVWLSLKLLFSRLGFWIQPNFWFVLISIGFITIPGAKAALTQTTAAGLKDPGGSEVIVLKEFKIGFRKHFWRALLISIIKWLIFSIIIFSIIFWFKQDSILFKAVSIISLYALVLWWISVGYLLPVLIENPELNVLKIVKQSFVLGFQNPYKSFIFSLFSTTFLILGIALLGPILLVIPVLRSILMLHAYWLITKKQIPGLLDIHEYIDHKTKSIM